MKEAAAAALVLLAVGTSSCGASTGAAGPPSACVSPPEAIGPDVVGTLGEADRGQSVCLHPGERINVFLNAQAGHEGEKWRPIASSATDVLAPVPNGALTLPIGVTAGIFAAKRAGVSRLTSTRPPCTSPQPSACSSDLGWGATVVVR